MAELLAQSCPPSEPLHDENQIQPVEGECDANVLMFTAEPTKPIMNEHTMGYESEIEGDSVSINSRGGSKQGSAKHVAAVAGDSVAMAKINVFQ